MSTPARKASNSAAPQREAEGIATLKIPFKGFDYEVPADPDDWPILATQAMSKNQHIDGIQYLLGAQQWARLVNAGTMTKRQFDEFAELLAKELGFGTPGN